jgi:hypothetical protein
MEHLGTFYWVGAVELNRIAFTRIVAQVFAMLGLVAGSRLERLTHALYVAGERLLHPAESALRRLIVIAARGLVAKPSPKRSMPRGFTIERKITGRMAFCLFDKRKNFDFIQPQNSLFVKIKTYSDNPFPRRSEKEIGLVSAAQLCRRLGAIANAHETLPSQARLLARWQAQRKMMDKPKFTSPLRPGSPGRRAKPSKDVDFVLQECHGLALDALREDSS